MKPFSIADLPGRVEYSLLAAEATRAQVAAFCAEARENNYHAVCVNGSRVELALTLLDDSRVQVVAMVDFPLGASDADARRYATEIAADQGAHEIDVVLNLGRLKDQDSKLIFRELNDIVEAADERPVKLILEAHLLSREEKILACQLAMDSGVKFVVTATDFHSPEITVAEIKFLQETVGEGFGIKAVGKVRDAEMAMKLIEAGATRVGVLNGIFSH